MNCPNCGAAMEVTARGYYVCGHCGTTHIPEAIDRDGVRVLQVDGSGRMCSRCNTPLASALLDTHHVEYCQTCRGILIPRQNFAELVTRRRAWAASDAVVPAAADAGELRRTLACPNCRRTMTTDWYYGPGNVVLNRCDQCDLVWLDYGELKQIVDAPGFDRGSRDVPRED